MSGFTTSGQGKAVFDITQLIQVIVTATQSANSMLTTLQNESSNISIADMFNMQMIMNNLSQVSEMATAVVSASNNAMRSVATNIKG